MITISRWFFDLMRIGPILFLQLKSVLVATLIISGLALSFTASFAQDAPFTVSPDVAQQIQAITYDKAQRTDAQKKIESALLYAAREASGLPPLPGAPQIKIPQLSAGDAIDASGNALVDITTADSGVEAQISSLGGTVVSSFPEYNAVRAKLPAAAIETLAASPAVKSIRRADKGYTNRISPPPGEKRSEDVRKKVADTLDSAGQGNAGFGTTISQAVRDHGAVLVQNAGITGAGLKICVLSDGIDTIAARQAANELPANIQVISGQAGSGDEGTAMLELIADMAPGASLGFATANGGLAQMASNIVALRNSMGCDIIVDDFTYGNEAAFQEDIIANAVTTVVNSGAMYFSSAANSGHLTVTDGGSQTGTWEGDFVDGGALGGTPAVNVSHAHNFGGVLFDTLTGSTSVVTLQWSDPKGASSNDYDLFVVNSAGTSLLGSGISSQSGSQDPFEVANCTGANCSFPAGSKIVVNLFSGQPRALRVDSHRGRLSIGTAGNTFGHNAGVNTISVAAISNHFVPIDRRFVSTDTTAFYSSDGPRRLFYNAVPSTVAINSCILFSCNGGVSLQKPDISAGDCDRTSNPNTEFNPFCGTSAAAPNAAAIAALFKSFYPSLTNAQVLAILKGTAIDIMAPGIDRDSGSGIIMADTAIGLLPRAHDFNGDLRSDILWQSTSGNTAMWLMLGQTITANINLGNIGSNWSPVGQRDFDGDTKSDILWRSTAGDIAIWFMNGGVVTSVASLGNIGTNWFVAGTGDFNGDGFGDILWRNTAGDNAIWFMNGASVTSVASIGNVPANWFVGDLADFNGDGKRDILWRNSQGDNVIWLMNGSAAISVTSIGNVSSSWVVAGTGDFNADGKSDILWRSSTGDNAIWFMNGATLMSVASLGNVATNWSIASEGDYNGDARADILWRTGGGDNAIWFMNGASVSSVASLGNIPTNWFIQNAGAD